MPGRSGVSSLAVSQEGLIGVGREDGNVMFTNWQGDKLAPPKQVRAGVGAVRSLSFFTVGRACSCDDGRGDNYVD